VLYFNWMAMILQNGGNFLDAQGKVDLATPEAIAAMTELVSYIKDDHVTNLDSLTGAQAVIEHGFMCIDEAYMAINGPWIVPDCETSYGLTYGEDFEYIAQPPFVEGKTEWAAETGWSLAVANSSKVADASWKFVEFLLQPANLLRHNIDCGQIPPRKSVANDPALIEAVPYLAPLISILDSAKYVGNYDPGTVKEFTKQMFISLVSDDGTYASVEEACQKLNADLEANVKYY
ncbi:MAG: extracellular solute-binding protein, partial [Raoultibacter sp.]